MGIEALNVQTFCFISLRAKCIIVLRSLFILPILHLQRIETRRNVLKVNYFQTYFLYGSSIKSRTFPLAVQESNATELMETFTMFEIAFFPSHFRLHVPMMIR